MCKDVEVRIGIVGRESENPSLAGPMGIKTRAAQKERVGQKFRGLQAEALEQW